MNIKRIRLRTLADVCNKLNSSAVFIVALSVGLFGCSPPTPTTDEFGWRPATDPELKTLKESLVDSALVDPFSVELRDVYTNKFGYYCGELNAKNRMGGYVGWTYFLKIYLAGTDKWLSLELNTDGSYNSLIRSECRQSPLFRHFDDATFNRLVPEQKIGG